MGEPCSSGPARDPRCQARRWPRGGRPADVAAMAGHVPSLAALGKGIFPQEEEPPADWLGKAAAPASKQGHLAVLEFLLEHGVEYKVVKRAVKSAGKKEVLRELKKWKPQKLQKPQ